MDNMKVFAGGLITLLVCVAFGVSGLVVFSHMHDEAEMPCPVMGHAAVLCPMSLVEHLARWQSLFLATERAPAFLISLILLVGVAVFSRFFTSRRPGVVFRGFFDFSNGTPPFIRGAEFCLLSRGILHSRLYA